jgi:hypothetical protein
MRKIKEQIDFSFIPDEISQYLKSKGLTVIRDKVISGL